MRSSAMLAIRGLIMLVTLVAVPALALFCKSVPSLLDKAVADCERRLGISFFEAGGRTNSVDRGPSAFDMTDAPPFEPSPEPPNPPNRDASVAEPWAPSPPPRSEQPGPAAAIPDHVPPAGSSAAAVSFEAPVPATPGPEPATDLNLPGEPNRIDAPLAGSVGSKVGPDQRLPGPPSGDRFTAIQVRLRELGANYYLLESWGNDGTTYRFHCKMPLAGGDRHCQNFESIGRDPLAAMDTVLRQVEQWRNGRQP